MPIAETLQHVLAQAKMGCAEAAVQPLLRMYRSAMRITRRSRRASTQTFSFFLIFSFGSTGASGVGANSLRSDEILSFTSGRKRVAR